MSCAARLADRSVRLLDGHMVEESTKKPGGLVTTPNQ